MDALTPQQFRQRLGLSRSGFYRNERAGAYRALRVSRPVGRARYSLALVERYLAGQPVAAFGVGKLRRAS